MIYTVQEIQSRVMPVAKKYGIKAVFLFGSYAKGTATEDSDIDLLIDTSGTALRSLLSLGALYNDLEAVLEKKIDLITIRSLEQRTQMPSEAAFREAVISVTIARRFVRRSSATVRILPYLIRTRTISAPFRSASFKSAS